MIRVGILSFSDGRKRVHDGLAQYIGETENTLRKILEATAEAQVMTADSAIWNPELSRTYANLFLGQGLHAVIFNVQVFAFPNLSAIAANILTIPILVYCTREPSLPGLGGMQAAANMIRQQGGSCTKVWGDCREEKDLKRIMSFLRAARAATSLRGQVYGLIGGRSIGMGSGAVNPDLWMAKFGIDVDHIDEAELLRRADLVDTGEVERAVTWLTENTRSINYDEKKLVPESLARQIGTYVATRELVEDRKLDFAGVKCHYDMSEYQVTQCLSAAFFNDPYDWNGAKKPFVLSCEADSDGALTMQTLKLIAGMPALFIDLRYYDAGQQVLTLCNCGAMSTWYASRSEDPAENLAEVSLSGIIRKYGGQGAHVHFMAKEGTMTLARLTRVQNEYMLTAFRGQCVKFPEEKMKDSAPVWPHAFVKIDFPIENLLEKFDNNHLHAVHGDWLDELEEFCRLKSIEFNGVS